MDKNVTKLIFAVSSLFSLKMKSVFDYIEDKFVIRLAIKILTKKDTEFQNQDKSTTT